MFKVFNEFNIIIKKIDKETINIQVLQNDILMSIVGQFNQNLIELEKLTKTSIFFRGNSISPIIVLSLDCSATCIKFLINKFLLTNLKKKMI